MAFVIENATPQGTISRLAIVVFSVDHLSDMGEVLVIHTGPDSIEQVVFGPTSNLWGLSPFALPGLKSNYVQGGSSVNETYGTSGTGKQFKLRPKDGWVGQNSIKVLMADSARGEGDSRTWSLNATIDASLIVPPIIMGSGSGGIGLG